MYSEIVTVSWEMSIDMKAAEYLPRLDNNEIMMVTFFGSLILTPTTVSW